MDVLVNIDVPDLAAAEAFYTAAFTLTPGRRFEGALELLGASSRLYLLEKAAGTVGAGAQPRRYDRHWTPVHIDFVVEDLDAALARALAAGAVQEGQTLERLWGRLAMLADPFGHGLCLVQFLNRGYDEIASPT